MVTSGNLESANKVVMDGLDVTSGIRKYPTGRDDFVQNPEVWLQGKRVDDGVLPYWRVHDKLYDFSDFIKKHPGGSFWLESTKGLDITEFFESSHFGTLPQKLLDKYYVKRATTVRNSPFTFNEDGFYKTLKRKVTPILQKVGTGPTTQMILIQDSLLFGFVVCTVLSAWGDNLTSATLAGVFLCLMGGSAHNFFHQRDNWRMLTFDLTLSSSRDWRVSHALSHHHYPNTILDYEISVLEPYLIYLPKSNKGFWRINLSTIMFFLVCAVGFLLDLINRVILTIKGVITIQVEDSIRWIHLLALIGLNGSVYGGFRYWLVTQSVGGFLFLFVSQMGAHQHPDIYHEGDVPPRSKDWGILQVVATRERGKWFTKSVFLAAVTFGNHTLHHLFPTVDHSKLPHLQQPFLETCREFGVKFDVYTPLKFWKGLRDQLASTSPNINYPSILKTQ